MQDGGGVEQGETDVRIGIFDSTRHLFGGLGSFETGKGVQRRPAAPSLRSGQLSTQAGDNAAARQQALKAP
jgi:hypothetical protein